MLEEQARELITGVLSCAKADHTEVWLSSETEGATRFANNVITQNVVTRTTRLRVLSAFGQRTAMASTNDLSMEGVRRVVERAESLAREAAPDHEYLPPLGPQEYSDSAAYFAETERFGPVPRAAAVKEAVSPCAQAGLKAAGSLTNRSQALAYGNSAGLFVFDRTSASRMATTAMTQNSSGWAQVVHPNIARIEPREVGACAARRALDAKDPEPLEPGRYRVILQPAAVADMLMFLLGSLDAKAVDEGRSALSGKLQEVVAAPFITIRSDPYHPDCPTMKYVDGGLPARPHDWIRAGRLTGLVRSRYWAEKQGTDPTGPPPNLVMDGGEASPEDLVAGEADAILVNRLWYIRTVDPMRLLVTGMTRDGLYRIRQGEVVTGLQNMRFNMSVLDMLRQVSKLGRPQPAGGYLPASVPPLVVEDWYFSSPTEF